ncbi:MAG TPA: CHAT domain-containing tetratricopeptide repeat protein [Thermoanaerobaculia bacterium]
MTSRLLALFVIPLASVAYSAPSDLPELHAGSVAEHTIGGKQKDVYKFALDAGQTARVTVEQKGIDVILRVADRDGNSLIDTDDEMRTTGREQTLVVADAAADFQLIVTPVFPRVPAGNYAISVTDVRPATDKERSLFQALELNTKAVRLNDAGKIEESRATAEHALETAKQVLAPDDVIIARLTWTLGRQERALGHYALARDEFQRTESIFESAFGRADPNTAVAIAWIGLTYHSENDYVKASPLIQEAVAITERVLGSDSPRLVGRLISLSALHKSLQDKHGAMADLERALRIADKTLDPNDFQIAALLSNLGSIYTELGDYDRAVPLLRRSLQMLETRFGLEHPNVVVPLQELGIIARDRKDYDGARAILWRAEAVREKALGLRHPQTLALLTIIANIYNAEGDYDKALELHQRVLELLESNAGPYNELTMIELSNVARTYAAQGNGPCAIEYQTRVDDVLEKNLGWNLAIGSERQKLAYAESTSERTDRTISFQVSQAPRDEAAAEHALLVLLQRKGRVLDAMSDTLSTARPELTGDDQQLIDKFRAANAELAKVALNGPGKAPVGEYRAQLAKLESAKEQIETRISERSAAFRAEHQPVTLAAIRTAIPSGAALIEFSLYKPYNARAPRETDAYGDPRYIAYVVRHHGRTAWKDLGSAKSIDDAVTRWRSALRDPQNTDVDQIARIVDRKLMQPLRSLLGNARQLLIAPDGQLDLIPFEALVDSRGDYLIEKYRISYVTSGRDLLRLAVPRRSGTAPVVVADPLFGEPAGAVPVKIASAAMARRSVTVGEDFSSVYFAPLAGTREEARTIHEIFPQARVLTGKDATKTALQHVNAPEILHVATHGFFLQTTRNGARNPLLRSGLALTGANLTSGGSDDGVLTALEASTLNLWGTKLVTLSACDSGVGEVKNREGVYGLRRSFFLAGAETVVMSLWPVSDYVTQRMMTAYYSGLQRGLGRGEALRQAELAMLHQKQKRHPFYWASFIQSGDWTPLE